MDELRFEPPIRLNREVAIPLPHQIATRPEASAVIAMLPPCGIHWCGVVACLSTDMTKLRLALASALDRHGFLSDDDVDARRSIVPEENSMVSRWLGMREMQERRKTEEKSMAKREQKSNRETRKPKKDKSKEVPAAGSSYKEQFGKPTKRK
jgi:hypothetical protein